MNDQKQIHVHNESVVVSQPAELLDHEAEFEIQVDIVPDRYRYIGLQRLEPSLNRNPLKPLQYVGTSYVKQVSLFRCHYYLILNNSYLYYTESTLLQQPSKARYWIHKQGKGQVNKTSHFSLHSHRTLIHLTLYQRSNSRKGS